MRNGLFLRDPAGRSRVRRAAVPPAGPLDLAAVRAAHRLPRPDGVGKSTVIDEVRERIAPAFLQAHSTRRSPAHPADQAKKSPHALPPRSLPRIARQGRVVAALLRARAI
jgi:hypothetical protein